MGLRVGIAAGVGVEIAALVAAAGWVVWQILVGGAAAPGPALALAVFALILAAALFGAVRAVLRRGSGPARAVVVTWQLVQAGSAGMIIGAADTASVALIGAWTAAALAVGVVLASVLDAWRTAGRPERG
ncbi:hypothetical protein OEB99_16155 [Actinotalea sp. M2MS4P-6]|uniref:hypothetical protein n=1 Tax=Actinotalea sp. M2MS4P-6 TaxID=2983762 RepID=UPI0021E43961|nr:hypothetical protein [Actinotalea sp. M2MS4P-6]MCV2395849.1 hypothetical protein [Actinotalea sp. M2MS4P-6]